jgi:malate dehydrogenase (oxaloacetate-decarboxylating)
MMDFRLTTDAQTGEDILDVPFVGAPLLANPLFSKGSAFSDTERLEFGLLGLLPPQVNTLDNQIARRYEDYCQKTSDTDRYIYLRDLQDRNEVLFYRLLLDHIDEMMPMIYTPVVGLACQNFSHIYRRPRGLFLSYPYRQQLEEMLDHRPYREVDVIVVTDGERILGLGDQGLGGMGIPIGKLSLYTLCGGIHPARTLPILLDVGTDNAERLQDPLYLGWRHERVRGEYDDFIDAFVRAVQKKLPGVLLQWEDFAQHNAGRLLDRYRDELCTFNDDIQGTAAVALAGLLAAAQVVETPLPDQRLVIVGAGSAGTGISEIVIQAMTSEGLSQAEARSRLWLVDRAGLLVEGASPLPPFQGKYAQPSARVADWPRLSDGSLGLVQVVKHVRPTALIGTSGQPGIFTEEVVREMASLVERPIIFALSNPASRCEAQPADLIAWTDGRAVIATGSPYADVSFGGRRFPISQCNNSFIFPGVGLGVIASGTQRVTDAMFLRAAYALATCSPARNDPQATLFPSLKDIRSVSGVIALAVGEEAQRQGLAERTTEEKLRTCIEKRMWTPNYPRFQRRAR